MPFKTGKMYQILTTMEYWTTLRKDYPKQPWSKKTHDKRSWWSKKFTHKQRYTQNFLLWDHIYKVACKTV